MASRRGEAVAHLFFITFLVVPILLIQSCITLMGPSSYRYRMTLYVETDSGIRTFSTVRQVKFAGDVDFPNLTPRHDRRESGEAIPIELPNGTYFAIMDMGDSSGPETAAFAASKHWKGGERAEDRTLGPVAKYKGVYDLPSDMTRAQLNGDWYGKDAHVQTWPTIVSFWDLANPSTIHIVDPKEIGVKRVTIEITKDPVSTKIESYFPADIERRWEAWRPSYDPLPPESDLRRYAIRWGNFKSG
jgi:hypothetical protein